MEHAGPKEHLMWVKKAKEAVRIPVIASLNAVDPKTWVEYARHLADQGVDALELNFFATPRDFYAPHRRRSRKSSWTQCAPFASPCPFRSPSSSACSIPIRCTSLPSWTTKGSTAWCSSTGSSSPTSTWTPRPWPSPSTSPRRRTTVCRCRFAGLLHGKVKADVCASTGIMTGKDVAKMILAGACAVQVVTALYRNGVKSLAGDAGRAGPMDGRQVLREP